MTAVHCTKDCTTGRSDGLADAGTSVAELDSECSRGPPQAEFDAHGLRDVSRGMLKTAKPLHGLTRALAGPTLVPSEAGAAVSGLRTRAD